MPRPERAEATFLVLEKQTRKKRSKFIPSTDGAICVSNDGGQDARNYNVVRHQPASQPVNKQASKHASKQASQPASQQDRETQIGQQCTHSAGMGVDLLAEGKDWGGLESGPKSVQFQGSCSFMIRSFFPSEGQHCDRTFNPYNNGDVSVRVCACVCARETDDLPRERESVCVSVGDRDRMDLKTTLTSRSHSANQDGPRSLATSRKGCFNNWEAVRLRFGSFSRLRRVRS